MNSPSPSPKVIRLKQLPQKGVKILVIWIIIAIFAPLLAMGNLGALALVGLGIGLAGATVLLRYPGIGFPLLVFSSLVVPLRISTGTQTSINISLLLVVGMVGLWIFEKVTRNQTFRFTKSPVTLPTILFVFVSVVSFLFGQLNWFPTRSASFFAQFGGLLILILTVSTMLVAIHRLEDVRWLKWATWILIIIGGIYAIGFAIVPLRHFINRFFQRAVQDSLFWTWLIVLAFSQAFLNTDLKKHWRWAAGIVAAVGFYTVLVTKQTWTSGWLPATFALFVVVLLKKPKVALAGLAAIVLFTLIRSQLINNILLAGDNEYSLTTRLAAWRILGEIIKLSPVFGLGPANYYWYTPFFDILGYSVSFNSHNNYIDLVAQVGLVGLALVLWIFAAVGKAGWEIRKKMTSGFERAYVYGSLGGLAGTIIAGMFGDWFMPFVYNVGMDGFRASCLAWFFLGGLVFLNIHSKSTTGEVTHA